MSFWSKIDSIGHPKLKRSGRTVTEYSWLNLNRLLCMGFRNSYKLCTVGKEHAAMVTSDCSLHHLGHFKMLCHIG